MNRKGNLNNFLGGIFIIGILAVVLVIIVVGFWAYAIAAPVVSDQAQSVRDSIVGSVENDPDTNLTMSINTSLNMMSNTLPVLKWIAYLGLFFFIFAFLLCAYFVRTYRALAWLWIMFVVLLGVLSMFLSNSYSEIADDPTLSVSYQKWGMSDYILRFYPMIIISIAIFGGIILFLIKPDETQGYIEGGA